jgi:hypothetical protein
VKALAILATLAAVLNIAGCADNSREREYWAGVAKVVKKHQ